MHNRRFIYLAAAMMVCATQAVAQKKPAETPADERAATADLNRDQADAAARQDAANRASARQYDAAVQEHSAAVAAAAAADAAYRAARAQYDADVAANNAARADYDEAYARWQADVAACERGERSRCAPSRPH